MNNIKKMKQALRHPPMLCFTVVAGLIIAQYVVRAVVHLFSG